MVCQLSTFLMFDTRSPSRVLQCLVPFIIPHPPFKPLAYAPRQQATMPKLRAEVYLDLSVLHM